MFQHKSSDSVSTNMFLWLLIVCITFMVVNNCSLPEDVPQPITIRTFTKNLEDYGASSAVDVGQLTDGNFVIACYGDTPLLLLDEIDGSVIKPLRQREGELLWIDDMIINHRQEILIAGFVQTSDASQRGVIRQYSESLDLEHEVPALETTQPDWYRQIEQKTDAKYIVLGMGKSNATTFGTLGSTLSQAPKFRAALPFGNSVTTMEVTRSDSKIIVAKAESDGKYYLVKVSAADQIEWTYDLSNYGVGDMVLSERDENIVIVGSDNSSYGLEVLVIDQNGNLIDRKKPFDGHGKIWDIDRGHTGYVVVGTLLDVVENNTNGGDDFFLGTAFSQT